MRLVYVLALTLLLLTLAVQPNAAQNTAVSPAPPNASLIGVSEPQADGTVTVSGSTGAVAANTQVVVRNLYTGDTQYTTAGFDGSFRVTLYGPNTTPFWISTARTLPNELRNIPGAVPGGPGTIVYGKAVSQTQARSAITTLVMDGALDDWDAYPNATLTDGLRALLNNDSLYVAFESVALESAWAQAALTVRVADAVYVLRIDRAALRQFQLEQTTPTRRTLGARAANIALGTETLELRISNAAFGTIDAVTFLNLALTDAEGAELSATPLEFTTAKQPQFDGFTYGDSTLPDDAVRFYTASPLGTSRWAAVGRANTLALAAGETLTLEMDVTFFAPTLPLDTTDLTLSGALRLQPVFAGGTYTNNGWSNVLTPSGLAIDNLRSDVMLTQAVTDWTRVIRYDDRLYFGLRFEATLPDDLPDGLYVPLFDGQIQQGENAPQAWADNALFGTSTAGIAQTRLPIVLNVGAVETQRLLMTILSDSPSDGSRGVMAEQDAGTAALSNRVRFNSPTYILAPGTYPLEPYLLNVMPNLYAQTAAPLIPFLWPGGRVDARVTRPDGIVDDLGSQPVLQNRLSTDTLDERDRFGAQAPIDALRATTLIPALTDYDFSAYGDYTIEMNARLEDVWSNRYAGGGTYRVTIAEPLKLFTGVLSGTPFEVGDHVYLGARLAPSVPAEVTVTVRVYPLDGGKVITQTVSGTANRYGVFAPLESFEVTTDGEYVIDYEARYTDSQGRLWAASVRSAGVIASPERELIAHGSRGLDGYTPAEGEARPAWYTVRSYPATNSAAPRLNTPFFSGDVAVYYPTEDSGIRPVMSVQDVGGRYVAWLQSTLGDALPDGRSLSVVANRDTLPLIPVLGGANSPYQAALVPQRWVSTAYGYVSAVRAGVTQRQFVAASGQGLPLNWDADDPLNGQIGAGLAGDRAKDYTFVFGGALVKNAEIPLNTIAIYAALGVAAPDEGNVFGARVYPPFGGSTGASESGPLLSVRDVDYAALVHLSGTQPGQALVRGEPIVIVAQAAPTLKSDVHVRITSPSGKVYDFSGQTNAIGYYFDPASTVSADEIGVWQVRVTTTPAAVTSAGVVNPPLPQGSVVGSGESQTFAVYVTLADTPALTWNRGGNIDDRVPPSSPINFAMNIPQGWTDITPYRTVTMPGYILEDGALRATSPVAYQYSPSQLALEFSNLELEPRANGAAVSDLVTITFAIEGTTAEGRREIAVRSFTVSHDKLYSFEKE